jgi:hypothetical protein
VCGSRAWIHSVDGKPQEGVLLQIAHHMLPDTSFQTDQDGRFRVEGLAPGVGYTLEAVRNGKVTGSVFTSLTVTAGETKNLGDVQAKQCQARKLPAACPSKKLPLFFF